MQTTRPISAPTLGPRALLVIALVIASVIAIMAIGPSTVWEYGVIRPMINGLILLSRIFLGNFGLAIIVFTILLRVVSFPLTLRQLHATKALTTLQPQIQELQKKYKDPRRRSEETMKLYREAGVNPLGCLFPMLIQFPIWIALYRVILVTLGNVPERLLDLSQRVYPWAFIHEALPLHDGFLWMRLSEPDPVMPILVGVSMYIQQKMMTPTTIADPRQQSMNSMMLWMMPLMFAWFTLTVPSGLAIYWVATSVISIVLSAAFVYGWEGLHWRRLLLPTPTPAATSTTTAQRPQRQAARSQQAEPSSNQTDGRSTTGHGRERRARGRRKNRRRGRSQGSASTGPRSLPGAGGGD